MASIWAELQRRNVVKVAVLYVVASWLILQVADVLFLNLGAPEWTFGFVLGLLILFFFPALIFAWVFEMTPEGLKRQSEVDQSRSITQQTGRRLNLVTIAIVMTGAGLLLVDRFLLDGRDEELSPAATELAGRVDGATVAAIDDATPIVAVLPFKATGSDDGGFLAAGLHDDLLTRLAKLDAFKVISRTSMMEYADTTKNMRQIGEELGAGYVLEGGVQALGDRVHINAQLIDALADDHIWAEIYDRELTASNIFNIQADIAFAIADQLHLTLAASDREVVGDVPTRSMEAYNAYLHALELEENVAFGVSSSKLVIAALEEAVQIDPDFALAWARLSEARTRLTRIEYDPEMLEAALAALAKARALQPELLEAELAWVVYLYHGQFDYAQALAALEVLGERAERNADSMRLKAWLYRRLGRFQDAYRTLLESQRLEPRSASTTGTLIETAILIDNCDAAAEHERAALELAPESADVRTEAAIYQLECTGDAQRASELLRDIDFEADWHLWVARVAAAVERDYERMLELAKVPYPQTSPLNAVFDRQNEAFVLRQLGRDADAERLLDIVAEELPGLERDDTYGLSLSYAWAMLNQNAMRGNAEATRHWVEETKPRRRVESKGDLRAEAIDHWFYARAFAQSGLLEDAIEELREMFENPGGHRFRYVDGFPVFDVLKDHPGYIELRDRFGHP
jgi:TolB-like protein